MVFTLTSQMYHRISVLVPVLVQVPEYLSTSTSTSTSIITLELTSTSTVRVPEIQYSSTVSTSTEYEYPSPGCKVGQSDLNELKLWLNVWHCLLIVYAKFQIGISKHVEKSRENIGNPKQAKIFAQIPKIHLSGVFVCQGAKNCPTMANIRRGPDTHYISVCNKSEASISFSRPRMQLNDIDLFWAVK